MANVPFNISYLSNMNQRIAGLLPVKVLDIHDIDGDFHSMGFYSNEIFGRVGTKERNSRHSFINLRCKVLHPKTYEELNRLGSLYTGIIQGKVYATWDDKEKDFIKSDILDGETGFAFFMTHFKEIKFKTTKSHKRALRLDVLNKFRDISDIHFFLVMPAGLRDLTVSESGRPVEDDINKLYRKVLMAANGIPDSLAFKNDPTLDRVRWSIQASINAVYTAIMEMLGGKHGFLQAKWGSRKVVHSTRNVITAMDPGSEDLESEKSFDNSTTLVGLYQTLRGIEPVITMYSMPNGIASELIENIDNSVNLIDSKTLKSVNVNVSEKERVKWGTVEGRSGLISHYYEVGNRHRPVTIDGYYLKLIYTDSKHYRLLNDISELPKDKDAKKVRPLTWAEYFYITALPRIEHTRMHITRYPLTGVESTYPTVPYLKTTVKTFSLVPLNENWEPDANGLTLIEFPDTVNESAFFDTVSPATSQLVNLGADSKMYNIC